MSAEVQESGKKKGNSKQKKMTVRVDFTPMVDMNMLLITFFMLCTSLSRSYNVCYRATLFVTDFLSFPKVSCRQSLFNVRYK